MAASGVWKRSSHADFCGQIQQEYHFPPEINVIKRIPTLSCVCFLSFRRLISPWKDKTLRRTIQNKIAPQHTPAYVRHVCGVPRHRESVHQKMAYYVITHQARADSKLARPLWPSARANILGRFPSLNPSHSFSLYAISISTQSQVSNLSLYVLFYLTNQTTKAGIFFILSSFNLPPKQAPFL